MKLPRGTISLELRRIFLLGCFLGGAAISALAQCDLVEANVVHAGDVDVDRLSKEFGANKQIPDSIRTPILLALSHFPELRTTPIRFRIRHTLSPLTTNRDWGYYFRHFGVGRRAFVVTISDQTTARLSPILFRRLGFNAQVGVAGHELSHVSDFMHKNLFGWLGLGIGHLSAKYVDRFEFGTDSACIAHGLGYNLLAWSCFVRNALAVKAWHGATTGTLPFKGRERYMNPGTILARLNAVGKTGSN
jgi:hypothetical protein